MAIMALIAAYILAMRCKELETRAESSHAAMELLETRIFRLEAQVQVLSAPEKSVR